MPSTYTPNTGIELPADGEQSGTWGDTVNLNMEIVDRAMNGAVTISLSGTSHTLTTSSGSLSDGQFSVLVFGGAPSGTNTVTIAPNTAQKVYFARNTTAQTIVLSQGSGDSVSIAAGDSAVVYSDGAGSGAGVVDISSEFPFATSLTDFGVTASAADLNEAGAFANTFDLPDTDGTDGQVMTTNGAGVLTFEDAGGGVTGPETSVVGSIPSFSTTTGDEIAASGVFHSVSGTNYYLGPSSAVTFSNVSGAQNNVLLYTSTDTLTSGDENICIGGRSGLSLTSGSKNIAIGRNALLLATSTDRNIALGDTAGYQSNGVDNICIGSGSGFNISTGNRNLIVGSIAANGLTTGSNNIVLGWFAGSGSNFEVQPSTQNTVVMGGVQTAAYIYSAWQVTSDVRDKTDFAPLEQGLNAIDAIETYTFKFDPRAKYHVYDDDGSVVEKPEPDGTHKTDKTFVGFKAQQVEEALDSVGFPRGVVVDAPTPDNYYMKETAIIPLLINAIKELKERVETLEANAP